MDTNSSSFDFSRRKFLHRCGMGMGALGLEGILQADGKTADNQSLATSNFT